MGATQHTPGPWRAITKINEPHTDGYCHIVSEKYTLAHTTVNRDAAQEWEANAQLIAAAPELLRLLSAVLTRLDLEAAESGPDDVFLCSAMRAPIAAAIATATGRQQAERKTTD